MSVNCTIITIGDELLIGQVIDTNSAFIAQQLSVLGISIHRRLAISDRASEIKSAITESWLHSDIIITTGGLGPTKDDITKKTICDLFGVGMKRDSQTFEHVKAFFEARNRPFLEVNQAQADIPANANVLFNARGTAPGMWIEEKGKILISLPGVPYEMEYLITTHVLNRLKTKFNIPSLYYQYIQTLGLGESFLAQKIEKIESNYPHISLAYLPAPLSVNLRLSGTEDLKAEIDQYAQEIRVELADCIYGDNTESIEIKVINQLKLLNKTITLTESCTGGYISNLLTNIRGASEVFVGGWSVYSNEFKHRELNVKLETLDTYTAVSEETSLELLINSLIKTKADFGISVVGYLEKSETVASPYAIISYGNLTSQKTKKIDLFYPRVKSKEAIAKVAMVSLYKEFLFD